jgi:Xaa-Pro aminopeptidase
MAASTYRLLLDALPNAEIVSANNLIENLHVVKSPREIEVIRDSVRVGDRIIDAIVRAGLTPGNSEADAAAAGATVAAKECAAIMQLAISSGPHSNSFTYGGLPGWTKRTLEEGDFFHVDCFGCVNGYQYDFGRACVVGGKPSKEQLEVLEAGIDSVEAGIASIKPGVRGREVYEAVHAVLQERDMLGDGGELTTPSLTLALGMYGHTFGAGWGWPWLNEHEERELQPGMTLAVETMPGRPTVGAGYFEQDILVTDDGAEVLTQTPTRYW